MRKRGQRWSCRFLGLLLLAAALGGCGDGYNIGAPGGTWSDGEGSNPSPDPAPKA